MASTSAVRRSPFFTVTWKQSTSSKVIVPPTLRLCSSFCAVAGSLLTSASSTTWKAPTQKVRASDTPPARVFVTGSPTGRPNWMITACSDSSRT